MSMVRRINDVLNKFRADIHVATNGGAWLDMDVDRTCRGRLTLSDHGPWLELTRDFFPRRKKGCYHYFL